MKRILSTVLALMICLSSFTSFGVMADTADAVYTFESVTGYVGENIKINVLLQSSKEIDQLGIVPITYDENVLTFTGFSDNEEFASKLALGSLADWFMSSPLSVILPLNAPQTFNGKIFTLNFKINENAASGTTIVSAGQVDALTGNTEHTTSLTDAVVTIKKQEFTGITFPDLEVTYDGTQKGITVNGNLPSNANIQYTNNTATDAGTYEAKAVVSAPGYDDLKLDATLKINPVKLTVSGLKAEDKVYDGKVGATINSEAAKLVGVIGSDDVKVNWPSEGAFEDKNASDSKTKAVKIDDLVLSGKASKNYYLDAQPQLSAKISRASIKAEADRLTTYVGQPIPKLTYTITDGKIIDGDELIINLKTDAVNTNNKGTYTISVADITGKDRNNYKVSFTQNILSVLDKKAQNVTFPAIDAKTYGDKSFKINVVDNDSSLGAIKYSSSNKDVATIDDNGNVTIVGAGNAIITITRNGTETIADLSLSKNLVVNKKDITVTANSYTLRQNNPVPELKYTLSGELVGSDTFTGSLAVNADGTTLGEFDITQGTLALSANYNLIFVKGKLTVIDKTPQDVTIPGSLTLTYGDKPVDIAITDNNTNFGKLNFANSNDDAITVDANGKITVVAAGASKITVTRNGDAEYADLSKEIAVTVNPAQVTELKTATTSSEKTAEEAKELNSVKAIKDLLNLPNTVTAVFGEGLTEEVEVDWADAPESYNIKGGTYTFVATPKENKNLNLASLKVTYTFTVNPVNGTLETVLNPVTVAISRISEAVEFIDIEKIPATVTISGKPYNTAWKQTINDVKRIQAGGNITLDLDFDAMGLSYMTIAPASFVLNVTDKYPVNVTVAQLGATYGTALSAPTASQVAEDDGIDDNGTYTYLYKGVEGTEYEGAEAPKNAGKYTVTATLVSSTHAGSATSEIFEIAPFAVTYEVDNKEKKYKDAAPEYTGKLAEGTILPYEETVDGLGITFACDLTNEQAGTPIDITAEASNKNYVVTVNKGVLTINKKPLSDEGILAPVIAGDGTIGMLITAGKLADIADGEYEYKWYVNGTPVVNNTSEFTPAIKDSSSTVKVTAIAKDVNYTGETLASEEVTVETYQINGLLKSARTDATSNDKLDENDVVTVDVTSITDYADLDAAGASYVYQWKLDGEVIENETAASYTIKAADEGELSVEVTANAPFGGTLSLNIGTINKSVVTGTLSITPDNISDITNITIDTTNINGVEGTDYEIKWYRNGVEFAVEGSTYTLTEEDLGCEIYAKAVAIGDTFTGEVSSTVVSIPAKAPSNVAISTSTTSSSITATFTANANGKPITKFEAAITDGGSYSATATVTPDANGVFKYTFEGLTAGTTYTITATAHNEMGTDVASVTAIPVVQSYGGGGGSSYYTLRFNSNGGTTVANVRVKKRDVAVKPADPTKDGFVFAGWFTDKDLTKEFNFSESVTANATLYAKWVEADISLKQIILTIGDKNAKVFGESKANDVAPKIVNSRTMLPIRFIAEALGATVTWTEAQPDKVLITKGEIKIEITINSDKAYVNNKLVTLDSPAFLENDRTYMPLRFVTENLGEQVEWDEKAQQVIITVK